MAKTKFAPGPWSVHQNGYGTLFVKGSLESTSPMGVVYRELIAGGNNSDTLTKHNAHLIAAAPELYEALSRLTIDCKIAGLQEQAGFDCWLTMADNALAKARGEEV